VGSSATAAAEALFLGIMKEMTLNLLDLGERTLESTKNR
jgi:hypothetical protein